MRQITRTIFTAVMLSVLTGMQPAIAGQSPTAAPPEALARSDAEKAIKKLMGFIKRNKKWLPLWAVDTAINAYSAYQTYRNGERVEEIERTTLAILHEVADLRGRLAISGTA
ncbi:MAG: hypothetical protein AAGC70_17490 [Pseudomonadota bacterium]